ncbi:MAG: hypothetical protein OER77_01995 [Myxococcales bacterium]|nr:hypothetical protein [Myxococcales bacterium]
MLQSLFDAGGPLNTHWSVRKVTCLRERDVPQRHERLLGRMPVVVDELLGEDAVGNTFDSPRIVGAGESATSRNTARAKQRESACRELDKTLPTQSPNFLVTPTMRSWNLVVGFLTDWERLRELAA